MPLRLDLIALAAWTTLLSGAAHADCAAPPAALLNPLAVTVVDTWKAVHVTDGALVGCLAQIADAGGARSYAYVPYDFICALPPKTPVTIREDIACCDTGDIGDFACGIKPLNPLAKLPRVNTVLRPAAPDRRAIGDLVQLLSSAKVGLGDYAAALGAYAQVPELKRDVAAQLPALRALAKNGDVSSRREAAAAAVKAVESALGK